MTRTAPAHIARPEHRRPGPSRARRAARAVALGAAVAVIVAGFAAVGWGLVLVNDATGASNRPGTPCTACPAPAPHAGHPGGIR